MIKLCVKIINGIPLFFREISIIVVSPGPLRTHSVSVKFTEQKILETFTIFANCMRIFPVPLTIPSVISFKIFYIFLNVSQLSQITLLVQSNNRNTRRRREICSKVTIKIPEWRRSGVFTDNLEQISHLFLVFLLLTLNK